MRPSVILMSALLCLAPVLVSAGEVRVVVTYLGQGKFVYKKHHHRYDEVVALIQSDYAGEHIDLLVVDMGTTASQQDKAQVCQFRQSLQTQVKMHLHIGDETRELFCN